MGKWIEYQPVIDELKHEWCNKCNKTCPYNNCKIYRVMQILRRQKAIPHEKPIGVWMLHITYFECSMCRHCYDYDYAEDIDPKADLSFNYCPNCGTKMRGVTNV